MEKINTEDIITALLLAGFDKVDSTLITFTLGYISLNNGSLRDFEFKAEKLSWTFNDFVVSEQGAYRLKDGFDLDTNVSPVKEREIPLRRILHTNRKLLSYIESLDFTPILTRKIEAIGYDRISSFESLFCDKEKQIISENIDKNLFSRRKRTMKR